MFFFGTMSAYMNGKDPLESHDFTLEFKVENFLEKTSEMVYTHSLYGYDWQITVYPKGTDDYETDLVAVKLANLSGKPVRASYKVILLTQVKMGEDVVWDDPDGICKFEKDGPDRCVHPATRQPRPDPPDPP